MSIEWDYRVIKYGQLRYNGLAGKNAKIAMSNIVDGKLLKCHGYN